MLRALFFNFELVVKLPDLKPVAENQYFYELKYQ